MPTTTPGGPSGPGSTGIQYRVYRSAAAGGPVDYSAPAATTSSTSASVPLPGPGLWRFVVRAFDPGTGLEDLGSTPVAVEVGPDGSDLTGRPPAPSSLAARASAPGTLAATWSAADAAPGGPTSFLLWAVPAGSLDTSGPPAKVVGASPGRGLYSARLAISGPGPWDVAVAARNARGTSDPRTTTVAAPSIPLPVEMLP